MEQEQEIQNGLDTFEPDQLVALDGTNHPANYTKTWFIPCRDTLRHWTGNKYNFNITMARFIVDPRQPAPKGRIQVAVYRSDIPIFPFPAGVNFATQLPSTYSDTGFNIIVATTTSLNFPFDTLALGGSYWIVVRLSVENIPINLLTISYLGWNLSDVNLPFNILQDTTSTGNLPTTYATNNVVVCTGPYPYVRCDFY